MIGKILGKATVKVASKVINYNSFIKSEPGSLKSTLAIMDTDGKALSKVIGKTGSLLTKTAASKAGRKVVRNVAIGVGATALAGKAFSSTTTTVSARNQSAEQVSHKKSNSFKSMLAMQGKIERGILKNFIFYVKLRDSLKSLPNINAYSFSINVPKLTQSDFHEIASEVYKFLSSIGTSKNAMVALALFGVSNALESLDYIKEEFNVDTKNKDIKELVEKYSDVLLEYNIMYADKILKLEGFISEKNEFERFGYEEEKTYWDCYMLSIGLIMACDLQMLKMDDDASLDIDNINEAIETLNKYYSIVSEE